MEHNALSLLLWHSISSDIFLQIHQNFQWILKSNRATIIYANLSLDGAMDAGWSENAKPCFLQKSA